MQIIKVNNFIIRVIFNLDLEGETSRRDDLLEYLNFYKIKWENPGSMFNNECEHVEHFLIFEKQKRMYSGNDFDMNNLIDVLENLEQDSKTSKISLPPNSVRISMMGEDIPKSALFKQGILIKYLGEVFDADNMLPRFVFEFTFANEDDYLIYKMQQDS